jgi:hypothetical protein
MCGKNLPEIFGMKCKGVGAPEQLGFDPNKFAYFRCASHYSKEKLG